MPNNGTFSANGNAMTEIEGVGSGQPFNTIAASGTWGGGTLTAQAGYWDDAKASAMTWVTIPEVTLTANGLVNFAIVADAIRVVLSGATAPNLKWWVR